MGVQAWKSPAITLKLTSVTNLYDKKRDHLIGMITPALNYWKYWQRMIEIVYLESDDTGLCVMWIKCMSESKF